MTAFRVIAMPYELGRLRDGVGRGPGRLLEAGAAEALASAGAQVATESVTFDGRFSSEVNASFDLIGQISERVAAARADGSFPVILSGSCFATIGVMAGLAEPSPGVVWLDAHADFNTPDSTVYGYFDGMSLAILTGGAWRSMRAAVPGAGPIPEAAVVLAGARDLDENERVRLRESQITHLPTERLDGPDALIAAVKSIAPSGLHLHVDLDVLDPEAGRANIYAAPGGLRGDQLDAIVAALLERFPVSALSLAAYDPHADTKGQVPPIALGLLRRLAAARA
jgi:arginase